MSGDALAAATGIVADVLATLDTALPYEAQAKSVLDALSGRLHAELAIGHGAMERLGESRWVEVATGETFLTVADTRRGDADAIGSLPNGVPLWRLTEGADRG